MEWAKCTKPKIRGWALKLPPPETEKDSQYLDDRKRPSGYRHQFHRTNAGWHLWFAMFAGLARLDGIRFTVFNRSNTPILEGNAIAALLESRDKMKEASKGPVKLNSKGIHTIPFPQIAKRRDQIAAEKS